VNDDKLHSEITRAAKAEALLRDELLIEIIADLEAEYIKALFLTHIDDKQARETLFLAVNAVRKIPSHLHSIVSNGKLANAELKLLIEGHKPKPRWQDL
jgi:hypothetical protein